MDLGCGCLPSRFTGADTDDKLRVFCFFSSSEKHRGKSKPISHDSTFLTIAVHSRIMQMGFFFEEEEEEKKKRSL